MDIKKTKGSLNRTLLFIVIAGAFALGVLIGRSTWLFSTGPEEQSKHAPNVWNEFRFIRPSLLAEDTEGSRKIRELKPFRYKVNALIDEKISQDEASSVSVYFRDLNNGNWFGINESERFSPERQLKLPLMIAYFKWSETNPLVFRKKLVLHSHGPEPRYLKPKEPLKPGKSYTVNELIFRMIASGDNDAYELLAANIPPKHIERVFADLYVNYHPSQKEDYLSLSAYASFFRVLFNASYLSEDMSEKALRYLSQSNFRSGMAAGVPADVEFSGKAGERIISILENSDAAEMLQLHEFGIVYHPERPFLLGITVRGSDFDTMAGVIRDITKLIYTEVDQQSE